MDRTAVARTIAVLTGVAALALLAAPAAAQSGFDSTTESLIQGLNTKLLYIAVPITVLVEGILLYTVWRFRKNDDPKPTAENRRLEITWTVATAIVLVVVGLASYQVLAQPAVTTTQAQAAEKPQDAVEVRLTAHQWFWNVEYVGENVTRENLAGTGAANTFYLPADRPVYLNITSADVIHAFHAPELGLKQDAVPGQHNTIRTTITSPGTYQLYCAEYCGAGHSKMGAIIKVVSYEDYQAWLHEQRNTTQA